MKTKFLTKKIFIINDGNEKSFTTGGIISENGTILIGCDDRLTPEIIQNMNLPKVTAVLCCDYRRSANAGILNFDESDKYVNGNFCGLLTQPELWWENPDNRWHIYKLRPDDDILPYGTHNVNKVADNGQIIIGDIKITALLTPGDTDYSMSYLVEDEGIKVVFCGGLLYKGGKIPYLYRLTKGIPNQGCEDYHGFLRGIPIWKNSLDIISHADIAIPYLGGVINSLKADIAEFHKNIDELYSNYADISAMNYYFDGWLNDSPGIKIMEQGRERDFPQYVKQIGNQCNVICSKNGNAIAIDCGDADVTDKLISMIERGEIKSVDALYITHYHDDHVNGCEYFRKHFECPIYADETLADVVKNPICYRLPCISPVNVDVTPLADSYSWRWQEFELTSFSFPGQTLYHGGLMVKSDDDDNITFFAGDSFTPTGIDDYCAYNRNLLLPDGGYFKCISILKKYLPDYIINQHVMRAFSFTPEQLEYMEKNLIERIRILSKLSVWDNINYALDEYFIMAYPYEQNKSDDVKLLIRDYADKIKCEIVSPKHTGRKNIYGIRVYIGDIYLCQKSCFIVNS
ncbi:MAG: MBL fold metallo-hydrolase [Oscillospiraceae bacterium]|nr:MBL fold metallo-hydrolase [Oscillospiraceae bacterium]